MWLEATAAAAGFSLYSWFIEPRWRRILHHKVQLLGSLPKPLRILHLSDLHFFKGAVGRKKFLHQLADCEVDFIFFTGDFIDNNQGIDLCIEALRPLKARYGIYAVLGNHDFLHVGLKNILHRTSTSVYDLCHVYNDHEQLTQRLTEIGIVVLQNQRVTVKVDGMPVTIAGIDDPYTEHDDIPATFKDYKKKGLCFTLIHTPDKYQELAQVGADLVLSGHTHGGQICIPFWGPIITRSMAPRKMAYGFNQLDGTTYYTTRGLGSSRLSRPRFLCRPEVVFFEIHGDGINKFPVYNEQI